MQSGKVKLVIWTQTSYCSEMIRLFKGFPHAFNSSKISGKTSEVERNGIQSPTWISYISEAQLSPLTG